MSDSDKFGISRHASPSLPTDDSQESAERSGIVRARRPSEPDLPNNPSGDMSGVYRKSDGSTGAPSEEQGRSGALRQSTSSASESEKPASTRTRFRLERASVDSWLHGQVSDVALLGYDTIEFLRNEPSWEDVTARLDQVVKFLENWQASVGDYDLQSLGSKVLNSANWQNIRSLLSSSNGFQEFVVAERARDKNRRIDEFCRDVTNFVIDDKILQYHEYLTLVGRGKALGLSAEEVERNIDLVCGEQKAIREDAPDFAPIRMLRKSPKSLKELAPAIIDDWATTREMVCDHKLSFLLQDRGLDGQIIENAKGAEDECRDKKDMQDAAIWQFLWKGLEYPYLHCGSNWGEPLVDDVSDLVRYCDADPNRLTSLVRWSYLERWLLYAVGDSSLSQSVTEARKRADKGSLEDECQWTLWALGEPRLRLDGREFRTLGSLVEGPFENNFIKEFRKLFEKKHLLPQWVRTVAPQSPHLQKELERAMTFSADAGAWAGLHVLGLKSLVLAGGRQVRHPDGLKDLGTGDWGALAKAIDDYRVSVWLDFGHGWKPEEALTFQKLISTSEYRAIQGLLWAAGEKCLRLPDGAGFFDVGSVRDLITAYEKGLGAGLKAALNDGRLLAWLEKQSFDLATTISQSLSTVKSEDIRLWTVLWHCGWKVLPLRGFEKSAVTSVTGLIDLLDKTKGDQKDLMNTSLVGAMEDTSLNLWLVIAQKDSEAAKKLANVDPKHPLASESILRAMGAQAPVVSMKSLTTSFAGLQEGDSREFTVRVSASGKRGITWGHVSVGDPRLTIISPDQIFVVEPGEFTDFNVRLTLPAGKKLSGEALDVCWYDDSCGQEGVASVDVFSQFPWKILIRYGAIGALIGAVSFVLLRLWLQVTVVFPADIGCMVNVTMLFKEVGGIQIYLAGLPVFVLLVVWLLVRRFRKKHKYGLSASDKG